MKFNENEFALEIISKNEFIDDYSCEDTDFLVTFWQVRLSAKAIDDYVNSRLPSGDWKCDYDSREDYEEAFCECESKREEWERHFEEQLGEEGEDLIITRACAEFFTAVKIREL